MKAGWGALIVTCLSFNCLQAQTPTHYSSYAGKSTGKLRIEDLPVHIREAARPVLENPSFTGDGPVEKITAEPDIYHWLLDHPEKTTKMWKNLGAKCMPIYARGPHRFGYKDENGTDINWVCVVRSRKRRVWYAEGLVKAVKFFPRISIKAIMIMDIRESTNAAGVATIEHKSKMLLHTGSLAMRLVAKIVGASAPSMAEAYMKQIQFFFGGMAEHLSADHPARMKKLLK